MGTFLFYLEADFGWQLGELVKTTGLVAAFKDWHHPANEASVGVQVNIRHLAELGSMINCCQGQNRCKQATAS
ncbi:MAG: hypothetical protein CL912_12455 [Deltaproteobacteria bacterium]|nr:hypothetical protein [Deltaproteobacteria bacterium]